MAETNVKNPETGKPLKTKDGTVITDDFFEVDPPNPDNVSRKEVDRLLEMLGEK